MRGDPLGVFESSAADQVASNPSRPEAVTADGRGQPRPPPAAIDHRQDLGPVHPPVGQLPAPVKLRRVDEKDGKASRFVGTDDGLGVEAEHAGTIAGVIDGKPSTGEFKE